MVTIFISHVDADKALALALAGELERLGYGTWYYERDSLPGVKYVVSTYNAIIQCEVFLILVSFQSLASNQVQIELERAHEASKSIIPILYGVTDAEYKRKNVSWRQMIGASTSCPVTPETVGDVAGRIARGLALAGSSAEPLPPPDPKERPQTTEPQRAQGVSATRQAKFEAAMEEGDRLLDSKDWDAAEAAYRRGMKVPGFGDAAAALDGIKAAQAGLAEEQRLSEAKRMAEEQRLAEESRVAEARRAAEKLRVAEEKRLAEELRVAEEKRLAEAKRVAEASRLANEKRAVEEKRVAEERRLAVELHLAEDKRASEARRLAEELRVVEEKRLAEEKRIAEEQRLAEVQRQSQYLAAVAAGKAALKRRDFEAAEREAGKALGLVSDGAKALALMERLLPTLEVRSLVDGSDVPGAVIGFSGKASELRTPITFKCEKGMTYEVSVSAPSADGRWAPAVKTFVADWLGPQVWAASLMASDSELQKLRVPSACLAAEWKVEEPYANTGWAQEVVHVDTGMAFRFIPPGAFTMGSPVEEEGRSADEVQCRVTLTRGFYLGKYPVTQRQWALVMDANPSHFKGADLPVTGVLWKDSQLFLKKLGAGARLPTEAEWEYACRAGTATALNSGKALTSLMGRCPNLDEVAWYDKNSDGKSHPVGQKRPNAWGLYDMHGNVWEWCGNWYGTYPAGGATDPKGPWINIKERRVVRGGGWDSSVVICRSAKRDKGNPYYASSHVGFRVVLPLGQQ